VRRFLEKVPGYNVVFGILETNTFKQSSITFGGTIINGALGAVFYILAARFLGPSRFGLLSVAIAVLTLVSDIGDLGTDTGLVNFVARHYKNNLEKAKQFLKLGLEVKIAVTLPVMVLGYFLSPFLAGRVFVKPEITLALRIAFVGVGALLFFSFITHSLQALERFWAWSGIQVGTNALRVVIVFLLLSLGVLNLENTMWLYIAMPAAGFILGVLLLPRGFIKVEGERSVAGEFFKYNKWVAAFTLVAALGARLDTFISARLLTAAEVGIYSAANQLVKLVPQLVVALGTVIAPKMASMSNMEEMVEYLKKTQIYVLGLVMLGVLSIPVVLFLIPVIYGVEYLSATPIFIVLLFAMLIFLFSVPIHMAVFYYYSYPKLFFWLSLAHLSIVAFLGWYMIGAYGAMGAAVTVLTGQLVNFSIPALWVLRNIKDERMRPS
jgi:O-antigen/teichoic acid export membrane protein